MVETATVTREPDSLDRDKPPVGSVDSSSESQAKSSRRRFTAAVGIGIAVVIPPLVWLAWNLWTGSYNPLRAVSPDNFYDLQARALFQGHLYLPNGSLGIEAFVHNGRQYTYFGLFPSLIRMPILALTSSLDGELTGPSILLAWASTALFSSLMLWRLRILMRGRAVLGWAEAASFGVLMATIMGGSVVIYLSATPYVYNEDFAWSVPLTIASLFSLLGVLERPSWGRVIASGVFIVATNLDRTPAGYACTIGAVLIAGWFGLGKGGSSSRRWTLPMLAAGLVPFLINCLVTYGKFGLPIGLPMADQIWAHVNAHRRYFLAANGGKAFSFGFLPSTLWAYLQPFGLRLSGLFPFIMPPQAPAAALGNTVLDETYPTASIPATMPLLFLLSCWGAVTVFRPRPHRLLRLVRIPLLTAAAAVAGVVVWGYIAERYMADFMPLLVLAGGVGLIDIWRRLAARPRWSRRATLGAMTAVAVYCIVANVAIATFPVEAWTPAQNANFVSAQKSLSIQSLGSRVEQGATLPYWAPAGQLFAVNNCSGLYLSTGNDKKIVPGQQLEHKTWLPVEQSPSFTRKIGYTFNRPVSALTAPLPLLTYGASTLVLEQAQPGYVRTRIENSGTSIVYPPATGWSFPLPASAVGHQFKLTVITDPNLHEIKVISYGSPMIQHYLAGAGTAVVQTTPPGTKAPIVSVVHLPTPAPTTDLCRSLVDSH